MIETAQNRRAAVIGAGVIGLAGAIELQRRGIETTLIDALAQPEGASWGNAGHIAVEQVEPIASLATLRSMPRRLFWRGGALSLPPGAWRAWLPFGASLIAAAMPRRFAAGRAALASALAQAIPAWRRLLDAAGGRALLREEGHLIMWESPATAAAGAARWKAADTGTATVRDADAAELAMLASVTGAPPAGAVRIEGTGQIDDLGTLASTLDAHFQALGGRRRMARVERVAAAAGGISLSLADGETLAVDIAVMAGGAASAPLLRAHGHRVPLIAERGYHIQSEEVSPAWPAALPPVVFEDRSMIVTPFRSGLRAASFVEFGTIERAPDPRKWARLRAHVAALGLPFRMPGREWIGARPTFPDYLPAIGASAAVPGLFYAFGHQHLGLTLAAITGEAIGALAAGEAPPLDLQPFTLDRFGKVRP